MFRVKICGITSAADARLAAEAGADAIGINFYPQSKRYCTPQAAAEVAAAVPTGVCRVGVFVDAAPDEIRAAVARYQLDAVQLHGRETPEFARGLRPIPLVRALPFGDDVEPLAAYLGDCHRLSVMPRMLLVDAARDGRFGGTGHALDWQRLAACRAHLRGIPLVLAGGLTPDNVYEAIAAVRPWAVDVASGVEASPGVKSPALVRQFVSTALAALSTRAGRG